MPSHEVIKEVGDSLVNIVMLESKRQKLPLEIVQGPPDQEFFGRKKNSVAIYLYELRHDHKQQQESKEFEKELDEPDGPVTVAFPRPLVMELRYAVAATGPTNVDETIALSIALKGFYDHPVLNKDTKIGSHFPDRDLPIDLDTAFTMEKQSQLLQSIGVKHHAMLGYKVVIEVKPDRELRRSRRVERRTIDMYDKIRPPPGKGDNRR